MKLRLLFLFILSAQWAQATHLAGGYIQAKPVAGSSSTYEITVNLYLNEITGTLASTNLQSISLCFGDGASSEVIRSARTFFNNKQFSMDTYRITHTYAGPGNYTILTNLANRSTCLNIPNAASLLFSLSTTLTTNVNPQNQTPTAGFPPNGFYIGLNQRAVLPLAATDSEGDSLAYKLTRAYTTPSLEQCYRQTITSYQFPNDVTRQGIFKLNNRTGELVWDAPTKEGYYSVVLTINEYRNGIAISETTQELLFIVADLAGTPSTIPPYEPVTLDGNVVTAVSGPEDVDILLTVFPNPVDDQLQVVVQSSNPATAVVRLLDINGRKLHELNFMKVARQHEQAISMSSLTPGAYLVQADIGGRLLQRKIVKR